MVAAALESNIVFFQLIHSLHDICCRQQRLKLLLANAYLIKVFKYCSCSCPVNYKIFIMKYIMNYHLAFIFSFTFKVAHNYRLIDACSHQL